MSDNTPKSSTSSLPPCGVYKTLRDIGDVKAGSFVYFHNHGDPGPGIYLPQRWEHNRAIFHQRGHTLPQPLSDSVAALQPLTPEGFYRVKEAFHCCDKKCNLYEPGFFVQLGYNGAAQALLFVPELGPSGIRIPHTGTRVDENVLSRLELLKLARARAEGSQPASVSHPGFGEGGGHLH